jgi:hypothetical protein
MIVIEIKGEMAVLKRELETHKKKGHENPPQSPFNKEGSPICSPLWKRGARGDLKPYFRSNDGSRKGNKGGHPEL